MKTLLKTLWNARLVAGLVALGVLLAVVVRTGQRPERKVLAQAAGGPWTQLSAFDSQYAACNADSTAITALSTSIVNWFPITESMPSAYTQALVQRCTKTEGAYELGQMPGISETNFVSGFNGFASQLAAPSSAQISLLQVRMRRVALNSLMPHLIGGQMTNTTPGAMMNTQMAPLEAQYVLLSIIEDKMLDPNFQVDPGQWESNLEAATNQQYQTLAAGGALNTPSPQAQLSAITTSAAQLSNGLEQANVALGQPGMTSAINGALDAMGFQR